MTEKLLEALRLRLTPSMAAEIRQLAADEDRTLHQQLRHLLRLALEQKRKARGAS